MRAISSAFRVLVAVCLSAFLAPPGAASAAVTQWPQAISDLKANPDVTFGTLPNGLRYAIQKNALPPGAVSMRLVIEAGSLEETHDQEGLAHLIEHMAFRGSTHVPDGEVLKTLQRLGLRVGADANATTGQQETIYRFDLGKPDAGAVDTGLGFLREIAGDITFSPDALDAERKVVLAEARQRAGPDEAIGLAQRTAEFPGSPIVRTPMGRTEVVATATPAQLRAYYDAYYRPERAVVVVVGDVDPGAIEAKLKALFSDWRGRGPAGQDPPPYAPTGRSQTVVIAAEPGAMTALSAAWIAPYRPADQTRAGRIDAMVRGIGEAAISARIRQMAAADGQPFLIGGIGSFDIVGVSRGESIGARGVSDLPATIDVLTTAQRQAAAGALTQAELDRVVNSTRTSLQREAAGSFMLPANQTQNRVARLGYEAETGEIDLSPQQQLDLFEAAVKGLTLDRVNTVLRAQFSGEGPIIFMASPAQPAVGAAGVEAMLAKAEAAPLATYAPPVPKPWTHTNFGVPGQVAERREVGDLGVTFVRFANGVRLTVKPSHASPGQAQVQVRFGHGRLDQPRDRLTASDWSANLLGMGGLSDLRPSDAFLTFQGRPVFALVGEADDAFTIGTGGPFSVARADLGLEMQYLAAQLTAPGWRADGWKSAMDTAAQLEARSRTTAGGVYDRNYRALHHPGDARWVFSTADLRATWTPQAARAFIEPILQKSDIEILVVGDVTLDQAIVAVAGTFGALPKREGQPEPPGTRVERFPDPTPQPIALHHSGAADQAIAEISWPTTDEHAAWLDIAPTVILADILRQRVIDRLRTAEGETYSPNGGAEFSRVFPGWGRIALSVSCRPEAVARIYAAIDAIAADLASTPVSDDELQRAIRPEVEGATRAQQQNGYWIEQLAGAQTNPDRLEYIRQTLPQLSAVTAADVQRVAKRWLRADRAFRIEVTATPGAAAASVASR
jgi:zinc protease